MRNLTTDSVIDLRNNGDPTEFENSYLFGGGAKLSGSSLRLFLLAFFLQETCFAVPLALGNWRDQNNKGRKYLTRHQQFHCCRSGHRWKLHRQRQLRSSHSPNSLRTLTRTCLVWTFALDQLNCWRNQIWECRMTWFLLSVASETHTFFLPSISSSGSRSAPKEVSEVSTSGFLHKRRNKTTKNNLPMKDNRSNMRIVCHESKWHLHPMLHPLCVDVRMILENKINQFGIVVRRDQFIFGLLSVLPNQLVEVPLPSFLNAIGELLSGKEIICADAIRKLEGCSLLAHFGRFGIKHLMELRLPGKGIVALQMKVDICQQKPSERVHDNSLLFWSFWEQTLLLIVMTFVCFGRLLVWLALWCCFVFAWLCRVGLVACVLFLIMFAFPFPEKIRHLSQPTTTSMSIVKQCCTQKSTHCIEM